MRVGFVLLLSLSLSLFIVSAAAAQTIEVGNDFTFAANSSDANIGEPRTDIDLSSPVNGSGVVSTVKVTWSNSGCANAFKIKFFRRIGHSLTMTAERGPFGSSQSTVTLVPPADVKQGDLIGVTKLGSCGNPAVWTLDSDGYVAFKSDVSGTVQLSAGQLVNGRLALGGKGVASEYLVGTLPVVGSADGALGSHFRTSLQVLNHQVLNPKLMHCRLIFRRAGTTASVDDPSLPFTLGPGRLALFPDVVAALGQSGLGSLDIAITAGDYWPLIVTRVYNDAGAAGTSGLTEDVVMQGNDFQSPWLERGAVGFLLTPQDLTRMRMNIGVRTMFSGATITAELTEGTGTVVRVVTKTYEPNWFEQVDAASFMGGPVSANQSIKFTITSGSAIIYGSTTDNTTNDPAMQLVRTSYRPG